MSSVKGGSELAERLQKILSACGVASRRQAEQMLKEGRVMVNGKIASLGDQAELEEDHIQVDGVALKAPKDHTYLMLHKPRGYVTTLSDEKGRKTVNDLIQGCGKRVYPVGRLDLNSEGLLLLTDDGALAYHLMHPSHEVEKQYLVWVQGDIKKALPILRGTLFLDGVRLSPAKVQVQKKGETTLLAIGIHQGKNRQVRRMCAMAGLHVTRLKRIAIGKLRLGKLEKGSWRTLTSEEITYLKQCGRKKEKF